MFCSFFGNFLLMFCSFLLVPDLVAHFLVVFFSHVLVVLWSVFRRCLVIVWSIFVVFAYPSRKRPKNYQKRPNNDQQNDQIMTKKRQKHDQPNLERFGTWPKNDQQMSRQLATKSRMTKKRPKNEQSNWQKNVQIILVIYPSLRLQRSHKSKEMAGRLLIWWLGYPVLATGIHDNSWIHAYIDVVGYVAFLLAPNFQPS